MASMRRARRSTARRAVTRPARTRRRASSVAVSGRVLIPETLVRQAVGHDPALQPEGLVDLRRPPPAGRRRAPGHRRPRAASRRRRSTPPRRHARLEATTGAYVAAAAGRAGRRRGCTPTSASCSGCRRRGASRWSRAPRRRCAACWTCGRCRRGPRRRGRRRVGPEPRAARAIAGTSRRPPRRRRRRAAGRRGAAAAAAHRPARRRAPDPRGLAPRAACSRWPTRRGCAGTRACRCGSTRRRRSGTSTARSAPTPSTRRRASGWPARAASACWPCAEDRWADLDVLRPGDGRRPVAPPTAFLESHEAHVPGRIGLATAVRELLADGPAAVFARLAEVGRAHRRRPGRRRRLGRWSASRPARSRRCGPRPGRTSSPCARGCSTSTAS